MKSATYVMAVSQAAVLLLLGLCGHLGLCGLTAVHAQFRVFRGGELNQLKLLSGLERLQVAARSGETQIIELTEAAQGAVVQESVSVNIDCLPWLNQNPAGSMIRWTLVQLDEFGNEKGSNTLCALLNLNIVASREGVCYCSAYWHELYLLAHLKQ